MKNTILLSENQWKSLNTFSLVFALFFCLALNTISFKSPAQNAPEENRFSKVVLGDKLDEPMEITLLKDGRVLFIERKGALKQYDPNTGEIKTLATIPVNTKYTNAKGQKREAEEGLMGLIHDPNFEQNHWIYMYYADTAKTQHVLARWELKGEELVASSKKVVLEVPTQREECCHTGGGMVFDKAGNLYLTVGNNTSNSGSDGYANLDERKGWAYWDDQRGAGNTNSLTGKILRITPQKDVSQADAYTIPKGNLFETLPNNGDGLVKKEIYTMGHRNPWRPTIDSKTGYLYWGEVGPDASVDGEQGPRGYDEFNQAKKASNFGWPYFIGDNKAYTDWDFEAKKARQDSKYDPLNPINDSPNNTGLKNLPPAQKAFIWYPYGISEEFPLIGSSGRSATGGPVFHKSDFATTGKRTFPDYYEGKWLITEFMRGWIMAVTMDENGNYKSMERFMPNTDFGSAIDMDFAPDGDLYVLELVQRK
jgi:cytochrome c